MEKYKVSIIVPIYNAERYLDKCIKSIVGQTHKNLEIILVNDGSTDGSLDICKKYVDNDERILLINKENGGVSSARNKGLENITGDYIGFVDSDDYISSDMYQKLLSAILENEADISECGYFKIELDDNTIIKHSLQPNVIKGNYNCLYNYLKQNNTQNFNCNKLYKKTTFNGVKYPNYKYSEDYVVNVQTHFRCNKKVTISDSCYYYIIHNGNATSQDFNGNKLDIIRAGELVLSLIKEDYPDLSIYVIIYILNKIRKLYEDLRETKVVDKDKFIKILVNEYKKYYLLVKNEIFNAVKYKRTFLALWLFNLSPRLYYRIEKLR